MINENHDVLISDVGYWMLDSGYPGFNLNTQMMSICALASGIWYLVL